MRRDVRIVIDTNVLVSGLRSRAGASYLLLSLLEESAWVVCLSATMVFEYEEQLLNYRAESLLDDAAIRDFLDIFCSRAEHVRLFYRWRPILTDPDDDIVLETAANGNCGVIITYNTRHFRGVKERFGIRILTPKEFLVEQGIIKKTDKGDQ
jgi:putative PIN family toxin of toxin-antitoxin system